MIQPATKTERLRLRSLGSQLAEIAMLPVQQEKKRLWTKHNDLESERPMVVLDQICWHELNDRGELTNEVATPLWKELETDMLRTLYKWRHFPADMVIEPYISVPRAIVNTGIGVHGNVDRSVLDPNSDVVGQYYHRVIDSMEEIEKIKIPEIRLDKEADDERREAVSAMFDGILTVRMTGAQPWFQMWDPISTFMGVEPTLYDIMDRPEFIHAICRRMTDARMHELDEYERLGLLDPWLQTAHCTYTYTSKQPAPDYDTVKPLAKDCWSVGLAQMFSAVGPQTYDEFEVAYAREYLARTGFCNYGCCDPLDRKIEVVRKLPNIRKISISPWASPKVAAPLMAGDYIMARKPNPAYVGGVYFDLEGARKEIEDTLDACRACGTPSEYILKDISTVQYQPGRLEQWERMAMECVRK